MPLEASAVQRASTTTTRTSSATSTNVTRDRGIAAHRASLVLGAATRRSSRMPLPSAAVQHHRDSVGQRQHHRHHDERSGATNPSPDSHSSTPSHQLRKPPTRPAYAAAARTRRHRREQQSYGSAPTSRRRAGPAVDDVPMVLQAQPAGEAPRPCAVASPAPLSVTAPVPYALERSVAQPVPADRRLRVPVRLREHLPDLVGRLGGVAVRAAARTPPACSARSWTAAPGTSGSARTACRCPPRAATCRAA